MILVIHHSNLSYLAVEVRQKIWHLFRLAKKWKPERAPRTRPLRAPYPVRCSYPAGASFNAMPNMWRRPFSVSVQPERNEREKPAPPFSPTPEHLNSLHLSPQNTSQITPKPAEIMSSLATFLVPPPPPSDSFTSPNPNPTNDSSSIIHTADNSLSFAYLTNDSDFIVSTTHLTSSLYAETTDVAWDSRKNFVDDRDEVGSKGSKDSKASQASEGGLSQGGQKSQRYVGGYTALESTTALPPRRFKWRGILPLFALTLTRVPSPVKSDRLPTHFVHTVAPFVHICV